MNVLAWDNEFDPHSRRDELSLLIAELQALSPTVMRMEVCASSGEFVRKAQEHPSHYDFFIIDWLDGGEHDATNQTGGELALRVLQSCYPGAPVFIYSNYLRKITGRQLGTHGLVFPKSKFAPRPWAASDIIQTLHALRLMVDPKKVFIISSCNQLGKPSTDAVKTHLEDIGAKPVLISPAEEDNPLSVAVQEKMSQCKAFVAICTPDDFASQWRGPREKKSTLKSGVWQPRQNVLFEIGMALILSRKRNQLTILQQGAVAKDRFEAKLPSDLDGKLTVQFKQSISECFPDLDHRLRTAGVPISTVAQMAAGNARKDYKRRK